MICRIPGQDAPRRIEWQGEPSVLTQQDYDQVKEGFVRKMAHVADVHAVYEHRGQAYDHGLSDLDLIVVCQERLLPGAPVRLALNYEDPAACDIYRGGPVVMPASLFAESALSPHWELRRLSGQAVDRSVLSAEQQSAARQFVALEQSVHILMSLARRLRTSIWPVKVTLGLLKGIGHNYAPFVAQPQWPPPMRRWWDAVRELRRTWLTAGRSRYAQLESLTREGCVWAESTCWDMDAQLRRQGWLVGTLEAPTFLIAPDRHVLVFAADEARARRTVERLARPLAGWTVLGLPAAHYLHFANVVRQARGGFRRQLDAFACPAIRSSDPADFHGAAAQILSQRTAMQQAWGTFLRRHGYPARGCEGAWWLHLSTSPTPGPWLRQLRQAAGRVAASCQRAVFAARVRRLATNA